VLQETREHGEALATRLKMAGIPLGEVWREEDHT
jgi:hypothetical protein